MSKYVLKDTGFSCCYCGNSDLESRKKMVMYERKLGNDMSKVSLKFKNQQIFWCNICKRHCLTFIESKEQTLNTSSSSHIVNEVRNSV